MHHRFASWLRAAAINDPLERRLTPLVQVILGSWLILAGIAVMGSITINGPGRTPLTSFLGALLSVLGTLGAWWIMRQGYFQVAVSLASVAFVVGFIPSILSEGLESGRMPLTPLVIPLTLVGLLASRRAWFLITGLTIVLLVGVLILELRGSPVVGYARMQPNIGAAAIFLFVVVNFVLGLCFDGFRQALRASLTEADELRQAAEVARAQAEQQARDLSMKTTQLEETEQQLRTLIATLETPTVTLASGILLAPLVGRFDPQRLQHLRTRLLHDAASQRARMLILDLAGVPNLDADVAQGLVQTAIALRLLGCTVTFTSITATSARQLAQHTDMIQQVATARSPQEVLASIQWN